MTKTRPAVERVRPPRFAVRLINPVLRRLLRRPGSRPSRHLILLCFTGRRTGRRYQLPVAPQPIDGHLAVLTNSGWRHNFRGGLDCLLYVHGEPVTARGILVDEVSAVVGAYRAVLTALGPRHARQAGLRINVGRAPTDAELAEAVRRYGLSYVTFDRTQR